jgi:FtsX-like permease family
VGSLLRVTVSAPSGGRLTHSFRVVSEVPLPVVGGYVGLGNGALFTISGYQAAACPRGSRGRSACRTAVVGANFGALVTKMVPGPRGEATITHYLETYPFYASPPLTPTSLINFGEAINFPLIFGAIVAIFGAATIAHLLVVSVSRRRKETGLLKVLGFTNRQVIAAVAWQATTLTLVGIVIGVPLGVIAGKATWKLFAGQLGVIPDAVVPIWLVVAIAIGVIVITNLLAIGPAIGAVRTKPGRLMYGRP